MRFDWDTTKSKRNRQERGFGFGFAALNFEGGTIEWPDDRRHSGEARTRAVGEVNGLILHVAFTDRGDVRRIISARVAKEGAEPMARKPMTLEEIRATNSTIDLAKAAATSEKGIRRHHIEDGEDPDAPPSPFRPTPDVRAIRARLRMTQEAFAKAIGIPVATMRNWEQSRTNMDPAVRSLLRVVEREPDAALRALAE